MSRFYFNVCDNGDVLRDTEGTDLDDLEAVREAAIGLLPALVQDELPDGLGHDFSVQVCDETGRLVFKASLVLSAEYVDPENSKQTMPNRQV